jgi:OPA family sugar phosphate sensor protein UhpC-like MFS transporter
VFNILFGFSSTWLLMALFWGMNAWFQGWGWPGCAKLLTHWYSQSERGRWWSLWNTSHNLGGALIPILAALCIQYYGWRMALFVPGTICIFSGLFIINRLRDIPQSLGLPPIEKFRNEEVVSKIDSKSVLSAREILFKYVLSNKYIWVLAFAYLFTYIIRTGFNDWGMVYLIKMKGYSTVQAASCLLWFEVGGFLGSLFAGWSSDKIFGGKRNPMNILCTFGTMGAIISLHWSGVTWLALNSLIIFFVGFFIFGPQMLIGMAAAELIDKKAAATSSGFVGCFAYIGSAIAGGPLGAVIKSLGWEVFFAVLSVSGIAVLLLLIPLWSVKTMPATFREEK